MFFDAEGLEEGVAALIFIEFRQVLKRLDVLLLAVATNQVKRSLHISSTVQTIVEIHGNAGVDGTMDEAVVPVKTRAEHGDDELNIRISDRYLDAAIIILSAVVVRSGSSYARYTISNRRVHVD